MQPISDIKKRIDVVVRGVNKTPNCEIKVESPRESFVQAVWSRGDRRVGALLIEMHQSGRDWRWLVKNANKCLVEGVPQGDFYAYRDIDRGELLPWEIVDLGVSRDLLERESELAEAASVSREIERLESRLRNLKETLI
jgi:hypothetical protein